MRIRSCGSTPTRRCALFVLASVALWYYLLMKHGTFMPLFVITHTTAHQPSSFVADTTISADWMPPAGQRVVVSFTTLPHHLDKLRETIESLKAQTFVPNAIYVNVPKGVNKRTGVAYSVPRYLREEKSVVVNRCKEYGPLTKLLPTLLREKDPDTIVITLDDDKTYPEDAIRTLVWHSVKNKGSKVSVGLCGWAFISLPTARGVTSVYVPWAMRGRHGRRVDVLQAVCGNAYRRGHFGADDATLIRELGSPAKACYTTDDINIAGYLRARSNVHAVIIPNARHLEPTEPSWKAEEGSESVGFRLSSFNLDAFSDLKCMRALDAQWKRNVFNSAQSRYPTRVAGTWGQDNSGGASINEQ